MRSLIGLPSRKPQSKKEIAKYLQNHFRYHTMNSWNQSQSYAHRVKVTHLQLTNEEVSACLNMLEVPEAFDGVTFIMREFETRHEHRWRMGFNGGSSGYLVLYQGGVKDGRPFCYSGLGLDSVEDFSTWTLDSLQDRLEIVWEFDQCCEACVCDYVNFSTSHIVEERKILIPQMTKVAVAQ